VVQRLTDQSSIDKYDLWEIESQEEFKKDIRMLDVWDENKKLSKIELSWERMYWIMK
jgi:hypothetical protein